MKEAAFLIARHRIIGCIKIRNDLIGGLLVRCNELFSEQRIQIKGRLTLRAVFKSAKRRSWCHLIIGSDGCLQNDVLTKLLRSSSPQAMAQTRGRSMSSGLRAILFRVRGSGIRRAAWLSSKAPPGELLAAPVCAHSVIAFLFVFRVATTCISR